MKKFQKLIQGELRYFMFGILSFSIAINVGAQCTNCLSGPGSSTYSGTFFASATNLSGAHNCLAINGIYVVDEDVAITSSSIFLGPDAEIRVQSGATLTLNNSSVEGCDEMWKSVSVSSGGILIADDVDFKDGLEAVWAKPGSELKIKNCNFIDNYIGLNLQAKVSSIVNTITLQEPLSNNVFKSVGTLLPPHAGETSYIGINISDVGSVTIGAAGYPQNQFLDLQNGIVAYASRVNIDNALFQKSTTPGGALMTGVDVKEYCTVTMANSTFNNCFEGLFSVASNLYIRDNSFSSVFYNILIEDSPNRVVRITDNSFTDVKLYGLYVPEAAGAFQELLVSGNYIELDGGLIPPSGIRVTNTLPLSQIDFTISNNDVEMYGGSNGIFVQNNRNVDVLGNNVDLFHFNNIGVIGNEYGINLFECGGSSIVNNTVIATTDEPSSKVHNISLTESEDCIVSCNYVDLNGSIGGAAQSDNVGFHFDNECPGTNFMKNSFDNHVVGLEVGRSIGGVIDEGFIGPQGANSLARDNKWNIGATFSEWGAVNLATPFFAGQSKFHVRNTSLPQMPPSTLISATIADWFDDDGSGPQFLCASKNLDETVGEIEKRTANGTMPYSIFPAERTWRAQNVLYRRMKETPALIGQDQDVDAFYTAAPNSSIGAFYAVAEGINDLAQPDASTAQSYETLETEIGAKTLELASVDAQLLTATGAAYDALVNDRRGIVHVIDSLYQAKLQLDSIVFAERLSNADLLIASNAAIVTSTLPEQYQQTVNDIYLKTVGKGILALTDSQVAALTPIANTCYYEGGSAVLSARIFLDLFDAEQVYDDALLCAPSSGMLANPENGSAILANADGQLLLSPNPARGQVKINFPEVETMGSLEVYDLQGVLKRSISLEEGQSNYVLPIDGFAPGFYVVSFKSNEQVIVQKLEIMD